MPQFGQSLAVGLRDTFDHGDWTLIDGNRDAEVSHATSIEDVENGHKFDVVVHVPTEGDPEVQKYEIVVRRLL